MLHVESSLDEIDLFVERPFPLPRSDHPAIIPRYVCPIHNQQRKHKMSGASYIAIRAVKQGNRE